MNARNKILARALLASVACFVLLLVQTTPAQAAEPIRWKLSPGETLRYELTQKSTLTLNLDAVGTHQNAMTQTTTLSWQVGNVNDSGDALVRLSIERIQLAKADPEGFSYDSANDSREALQELGVGLLIAGLYEKLADAELQFVLTPQGEVRDFRAPEDLLLVFETFPAKGNLRETFSARGIQRLLLSWLPALSADELEAGKEWTTSARVEMAGVEAPPTVSTTYRYAGERQMEGKTLAVVEPKTTLRLDEPGSGGWSIESQTSTGEILFDRAAGRLTSSRVNQKIVLQRSIAGTPQLQTIEQSLEARLLPE